MQEWNESEILEQYDGAIIESPKNTNRRIRKSRLHFIQNEEDIEDEDLDELNDMNGGGGAMSKSQTAAEKGA